MESLKFDRTKYYSFGNGVKLNDEEIKRYVDEVIQNLEIYAINNEPLAINKRGSGNVSVIGIAFRKPDGRYDFEIHVSEGYLTKELTDVEMDIYI